MSSINENYFPKKLKRTISSRKHCWWIFWEHSNLATKNTVWMQCRHAWNLACHFQFVILVSCKRKMWFLLQGQAIYDQEHNTKHIITPSKGDELRLYTYGLTAIIRSRLWGRQITSLLNYDEEFMVSWALRIDR